MDQVKSWGDVNTTRIDLAATLSPREGFTTIREEL